MRQRTKFCQAKAWVLEKIQGITGLMNEEET